MGELVVNYKALKCGGVSLVLAASLVISDSAPVFGQVAIEEIIVTTRKREEALQDIPLVITAFSADDLARKGLDSLDSIARLTPGVSFDQGTFPQDMRIVIRGLSPTRGRSNVALLLDGVDVTSESVQSGGGSMLINPRLFDMERVEIVKGPQSALYGRSAFAGAINYVTKKPTNEWESTVALEAGQRNQMEGKVGIYGPLSEDKVYIGLNASVWNHDGFYDNSVTGADLEDNDGIGFALSSVVNFSEELTFNGRLEYTDDHIGQPAFVYGGQNTRLPIPQGAYPPAFPPFSRDGVVSPAVRSVGVYTGKVPDVKGLPPVTITEDPLTGQEFRGTDRKIFRVAATFDWDLDWGTATSVTHFADGDVSQAVENNPRKGSWANQTTGTIFRPVTDTSLFSQELRLQSDQEESVRWMVGGLYWEEKVDQQSFNVACLNNQLFPFAPFIPCGPLVKANFDRGFAPNIWVRDTEHMSAFGMIEVDISDEFTVHVEGRFTDEELFVTGPSGPRIIDTFGLGGPANSFPPATPGLNGTDDDSYFTPRLSLEYTASEDILLYASLSKGAKPSGVSTVGAGSGGFDPELFAFERETMWVYEVGAKTSWLDGSVVANLTGYYEDFSGKQTTSQILRSNGLTGTLIVNASSAEVKGLEFDVAWAPTEGLNLSAGYAYADATYGRYITNGSGVAVIAAVGTCTKTQVGTVNTCALDRSGNRLEDTAKHSLILGASYSAPITSDIDWLIETDIQYNGNRFDTADNILTLPGYWMADLRLGLRADNWDIIAFADNLFNDDTIKAAFNTTDFDTINIAFFPPPFTFILENALQAKLPNKRQIGVRASYNF
ncbi:MAG: TonB-dependent receptor [Rhodospirillaceae bacterium]